MTKANYKSEPTKVTTYLALEAELRAVFCDGFEDNLLCYNGTTLYMSLNVRNHGLMPLLKPNLGISWEKFFIIFLFYHITISINHPLYMIRLLVYFFTSAKYCHIISEISFFKWTQLQVPIGDSKLLSAELVSWLNLGTTMMENVSSD